MEQPALAQTGYIENYRSPATRKHYERALKQVEEYSRINLRTAKAAEIKESLKKYISHLRQKGLSYSKQNIAISAVEKWCTVNEIDGINFKSIRQNYSGGEDAVGIEDQPYSMEQLRKMVELANVRVRAIILLMVSSGVRVGAVPGIRLKDLKKLEEYGIYRTAVYPDSKKYRYTAFTTPEATSAIDDYLHTREIKGEKLQPDSPLFRHEFPASKANDKNAIKPLTEASIFKLVSQVTVNAGVRVLKKGTTERHTTPLLHSFRKIANTAFVQADIPEIKREMLLGHSTGLQGRYTRIEDKETDLAREYVKAMDLLTVSQEEQLRAQVQELQNEVSDIDTMKRSNLDLRLQVERLEKIVHDMQRKKYQSGEIVMEDPTASEVKTAKKIRKG